MKTAKVCWLLVAVAAAGWAHRVNAANPSATIPLSAAHAHNDYEHTRPLRDALDQGFCSVEADVHLVGGELLVGHDLSATTPDRTLQRLYLEPLRERVKANRGHVFAGAIEFTLLVDIKSDADPTYEVLRGLLRTYRAMLTQFRSDRTFPGAVTVILSGNRPIEKVKAERTRWCAIDGRLPDLDLNPSIHLVPLISSSWSPTFSWKGEGEILSGERAALKELVMRTHAQGRRIRFWGTADDPRTWQVLRDSGVDLLNADDLVGLRRFLRNQPN